MSVTVSVIDTVKVTAVVVVSVDEDSNLLPHCRQYFSLNGF